MISQTELIVAITTALAKSGHKNLLPRHVNAVIRAADQILAELHNSERTALPGCGLDAWLESDQTGLSSRFMAVVLAQRVVPGLDYAHPHDPADFGRCLGLLAACPELRQRLPKIAETSVEWARLVEHWDELEALYHQEAPTGSQCPQLYQRMKTLLTRLPQ